jgi:hypothetical protein
MMYFICYFQALAIQGLVGTGGCYIEKTIYDLGNLKEL